MASRSSSSILTWLLLACTAVVALRPAGASAAELCRFAGSTDHAGHVVVTSEVAAKDGATQVDVALTFDSTTMFWLPVRYRAEEVSVWRGGELESVAVNIRSLVGDYVVRQQWDNFQRAADGLQAYRVQAKTLAEFRLRHPGFVRHWDPATFGRPWLGDYPSASAERRADLDLKGAPLPPGLRSPLAMAFYWVRWLPAGGGKVPVFLPGFKVGRLANLPISGTRFAGDTLWRAPLRHPALSVAQPSVATARTSADGHLLQLAFEVHEPSGSARGLINQEGCEGTPVVPADRRQ